MYLHLEAACTIVQAHRFYKEILGVVFLYCAIYFYEEILLSGKVPPVSDSFGGNLDAAGTSGGNPYKAAIFDGTRQASVAHTIPFNVLNNSFELKSSLSPTLILSKTPTKSEFSRKNAYI